MVASSSNLMVHTSTHLGHHMHVLNDSTIPNDHDLPQLPSMNRGFMIRSTSNNNIRGSTGNLKDLIMLETVAPTAAAAAYPIKNGAGFSSLKSSINNKKKNKCMSGGNLKNLLYVLETVAPPTASSLKAPSVPLQDDEWCLGDDEEGEDIISDDAEEEEDIITPITTETTTRPAATITPSPSTPERKPSPSPPKEEQKIASIRVEAMKMKMKDTTIRLPIIEHRSSIESSSSSSSSSMGSSNLKDIMLETAALSSASVSSLQSSRSASTSSPVPEPAPTLNATWSTNTSIEALKSMHRFFSIPLSAPKMPDLFSCGTTSGGDTTSFVHQKVNKDYTKKMSTTTSTTTSTPIQKKKNDHEQHDAVNVHLGNRLREVKKDLFFKLNLPPSSQNEEECSGRTATTTSSTCMSPEEEQEESFFGMETTKLSPRIMMFYQDDDGEDDDDDDDDDEDIMMMNMAPSSASRLSFYKQEQEEVQVTPDVNENTPSSASTLSLLTGIALSLASPVSDDTKDDHDDDHEDVDDDEYGIFLSFSEDENDDHQYNDGPSSPSLKYNDYAFHKTTTATTGGRGRRQQWME